MLTLIRKLILASYINDEGCAVVIISGGILATMLGLTVNAVV